MLPSYTHTHTLPLFLYNLHNYIFLYSWGKQCNGSNFMPSHQNNTAKCCLSIYMHFWISSVFTWETNMIFYFWFSAVFWERSSWFGQRDLCYPPIPKILLKISWMHRSILGVLFLLNGENCRTSHFSDSQRNWQFCLGITDWMLTLSKCREMTPYSHSNQQLSFTWIFLKLWYFWYLLARKWLHPL